MPESQAQLRLAHEVQEGRSSAMPKKVADEMIRAFHGRHMDELPERASVKEKMHQKLYGRKR